MFDVKLFREIAALHSISKGAAACGVSQSAASQHVQEVERRLGVILFDRGKRPLELTAAGRIYADYCRDVLRREEEFARALEAIKGGVEGTLKVASIYSIGLSEMTHVRQQFTLRHPAAHLEVEYMRPDRVYDAVRNDAAELGLVSYPQGSRDIAAIAWREEEMQLAVPPGHPLASRAQVEPSDLNGAAYVGFDEDLAIRREIDRFLKAEGVEVRLTMHFDNVQMIKEAVALGSGVAILPARTMQAEVGRGRLAAVRLRPPGLARPVGIVHRRRRKLSRAAEAFLDMVVGRTS